MRYRPMAVERSRVGGEEIRGGRVAAGVINNLYFAIKSYKFFKIIY